MTGTTSEKNKRASKGVYIAPDDNVVNMYVKECADTVYNNGTSEFYFFQGGIGRKILGLLGAKRSRTSGLVRGAKPIRLGYIVTKTCMGMPRRQSMPQALTCLSQGHVLIVFDVTHT